MVEFRDLRSGEENELIRTMYDIFKDDPAIVKRDYFRKHVANEHTYNPSNVKVAADDGRILSHVVIQEREMYVPNGTITVGGIALVGTLESQRGRGYAARLIDLAIADMRSRDYDASMLFTQNPYFEGKAWRPLKREYVVCALKTDAELKSSAVNFGDVPPNNSLRSLQINYSSFSEGRRFLLKRTKSYWENRLSSDVIFPKENFWFFSNNGNFVGYAVLDKRGKVVEIKEAVWADNATLDDIVLKASEVAGKSGLNGVGMFGPWLKRYKVMKVIDGREGDLISEDLCMLPLKVGVEVPKEPVLFWPTDHF